MNTPKYSPDKDVFLETWDRRLVCYSRYILAEQLNVNHSWSDLLHHISDEVISVPETIWIVLLAWRTHGQTKTQIIALWYSNKTVLNSTQLFFNRIDSNSNHYLFYRTGLWIGPVVSGNCTPKSSVHGASELQCKLEEAGLPRSDCWRIPRGEYGVPHP